MNLLSARDFNSSAPAFTRCHWFKQRSGIIVSARTVRTSVFRWQRSCISLIGIIIFARIVVLIGNGLVSQPKIMIHSLIDV